VKLVSVRASRAIAGLETPHGGTTPRLQTAWCAIELASDDALIGTGFVPVEHVPLVERIARELLHGEDPRGVSGLWQRMVDATSASPYAGAASAAIAALDLALWDLKAQVNGDPLWRALGASRPRVNAHLRVSALDAEQPFRDGPTLAREHGFRGACLVTSNDPMLDERRLRSLHEALATTTDMPALMLDLDERCTPKDAERRIRSLERELDLTWVEAPTSSTDCAGLKRISNAISAAVCGGRHLGGPHDFIAHFRERSLDVVQLGFQNAGITGALQIADTAFGFELPVAVTASPGNLNAHLAAALPLCMSLEIAHPAQSEVVASDVRVEDGWALVGDRPGHGVVIDRSSFERAGAADSAARSASKRELSRNRARASKR
jgi:L-alanine-DL-glutamate epimerase-like enolase superfamily enzyme